MNDKLIPYLIGLGVVIIAGSSFILSFFNLARVAETSGISLPYAYLWPVSIDVFLGVATLYILRASLLDESPLQGWAVLISFTIISVAFNITNSPQNLIAQAAHAIPPVSLCISLELLMSILKSDLRRTEQAEEVSEMDESQAEKFSDTYLRVKEYLQNNPGATNAQAKDVLGVSETTIWRYRKKLMEAGVID